MLAFYHLSVLNIFFDETGFDSYHKVTVRDHICVPKFNYLIKFIIISYIFRKNFIEIHEVSQQI